MIAGQTTPLLPRRRVLNVRTTPTGLGYLFAAAVVNRQFRQTLLENPETALKNGYLGEVFELSIEERKRVTSASAHSLADLAKTITDS